ncbi:MAG TPA: tetratricopeptide repeat protein [Spirochaetota bacterium]|nr:tetratricopeptide repeat protein [Spirochaetota bacterium]
MEKRNVTIHRDGLENVLMAGKEYIKSHRRPVAIIVLAVLVLTGAGVAGFVYYDKTSSEDLRRYEAIISEYQNQKPELKTDAAEVAVVKMTNLVKSSRFGYVHRHGKYILAGLLFETKKFEEAKKMYLEYADDTDSAFTPLALFQAGICAESLNQFDKANEIYKQIEKKYKDSVYADRILYDLGRMAQKKGDGALAKDCFSRLLSQYPNSPFTVQAKARLFMNGMTK